MGLRWATQYEKADWRHDMAAGLTVGAMLVPQAMAYALLAGLPAQVGLYAAIVPVLAYAVFGTSRHLAVGPVAIVSLLTASALAPIAREGTEGYIAGAAALALMVGVLHLVLAAGRLGFLVNFLSHSVLIGFTAAAATIIAFSQVKHLLGISIDRQDHFFGTVREVIGHAGDANTPTLILGTACLAALVLLKRFAPRLPASLVVVAASIGATKMLALNERGVEVVGDVAGSLPGFAIPDVGGSVIADLFAMAVVITLVGFMESIAIGRVYARRHRYDLSPNGELVGLGAANVAAGLFGGFPVTGGFSRSAVNDETGARTPLASVISAGVVVATLLFLTPLFASLPNAALGATILIAVLGLLDVQEMRHIASVKRSDLVGLSVAYGATLLLGIELGIVVAIVASMLVVFARMSTPHAAVLGHVANTTSYRNIDRFPEALVVDGIRIVRIDAALSFVNAVHVKNLLLSHADEIVAEPRAMVIDASGINDLDATGAQMLAEVLVALKERDIRVHFCGVKGPVRDVMHRAGIWGRLDDRLHPSAHDAVSAIESPSPLAIDHRRAGVDERNSDPVHETTEE